MHLRLDRATKQTMFLTIHMRNKIFIFFFFKEKDEILHAKKRRYGLSTAEAVEIRARRGNTMIVQINGKKTAQAVFLQYSCLPCTELKPVLQNYNKVKEKHNPSDEEKYKQPFLTPPLIGINLVVSNANQTKIQGSRIGITEKRNGERDKPGGNKKKDTYFPELELESDVGIGASESQGRGRSHIEKPATRERQNDSPEAKPPRRLLRSAGAGAGSAPPERSAGARARNRSPGAF